MNRKGSISGIMTGPKNGAGSQGGRSIRKIEDLRGWNGVALYTEIGSNIEAASPSARGLVL